jgi:hypothetical protein
MKKAILFATHIPTPDKLFVGQESLDKFVESFSEYDIYIGINNSCKEWIEMVEDYSKKLNIFFEITPEELLETSGGAAYQTALRLLKQKNIKYEIYWFGHTKGATSNAHDFRREVFSKFWNHKELIEKEILENNISLYSPYIGETVSNYLNTTLPIFIDGKLNDNLASYYSFWVHSGEVINKFIDNCNIDFFYKNLLSFKRLEVDQWGTHVDRYFFERDFPMIYQKLVEEPKLLYDTIYVSNSNTINNVQSNPNNRKIIIE